MKKLHQKVQQAAVALRASGGRSTELAKRKSPTAEVLAMFASIDQSGEFTVANALADYANVKVKY